MACLRASLLRNMLVTFKLIHPSASLSHIIRYSLLNLLQQSSLSLQNIFLRFRSSVSMAVAQGSKTVKKASATKKTKAPPSHPPYLEMIKEALVSLKERTGSSHYAIAKHIEEQQKVRDLPPTFKKLLSIQLKRFVASGKLVKIKNSFKLPAKNSPASATDSKPKPKEASKKKEKTTTKPKSAAPAKPKSAAPAKPKAKTVKAKSPAKKSGTVKKVAPAKAKKPKSIKSPVKKGPVAKKAKK